MDTNDWWIYFLECLDGSHYLGITQDVPRRVEQHRTGRGGRYTRSRGVSALLGAAVGGNDRTTATRLERRLKRWSIDHKLTYFVERNAIETLALPGWNWNANHCDGPRWDAPSFGTLANVVANTLQPQQSGPPWVPSDLVAAEMKQVNRVLAEMKAHWDTDQKPAFLTWLRWIACVETLRERIHAGSPGAQGSAL